MVADSRYPMVDGGVHPSDETVSALHDREVARLVAFVGSGDRAAGIAAAEDVAGQAFLEVAADWRDLGGHQVPETYLYACALRIVADRARRGRPGWGDALAESAPSTLWGPPEVARLIVLQDGLDRLPEVSRLAVLLREMCGFSPAETAEVMGLSEHLVDAARGEALRTLVPAVEAGTSAAQARPGPLSPDDFLALSRALGHGDAERWAARRRLADRLAGQARSGGPGGAVPSQAPTGDWSPSTAGWQSGVGWQAGADPGPAGAWNPAPQWNSGTGSGWSPEPVAGWSSEPAPQAQTALDMPLSAVDMSANVGTPIFDSVSAWFASGPAEGSGSSWAALDDGGWRAANARAAAEPEVAGLSVAGLPQRRPGANRVPSASDLGSSRGMFGEPARVDPGLVRRRLDSYQQGLTNARRRRRAGDEVPEVGADSSRGWEGFTSTPATVAPAPSEPALPPNPLLTRYSPVESEQAPAGRFADPFAFDDFYRDYLPQLLALLMGEGASPVVAAQLAQDVMSDVRHRWTELDGPWDWARNRALAAYVQHRRGGN
jgi:DNA-directed RNA polymerase specialized sigma24 family protein